MSHLTRSNVDKIQTRLHRALISYKHVNGANGKIIPQLNELKYTTFNSDSSRPPIPLIEKMIEYIKSTNGYPTIDAVLGYVPTLDGAHVPIIEYILNVLENNS